MLRTNPAAVRRVTCHRQFSISLRRQQNDERPTSAPKQFPDIRGIRHAPQIHEKNAILRNYPKHRESPERIVELFDKRHNIERATKEARLQLKRLEQELGAARAKNDEITATQVYNKIKPLRNEVDEAKTEQARCDEEAHSLALALPNLTSPDTPTNGKEKLIRYLNYDETDPHNYSAGADHTVIGQRLGLLDFVSASNASGWGFYYLLNEAALLEQALIQYAFSVARRYGWQMVIPPSLVYSHVADSCGFQPRDANDEQQIWQIAQAAKDTGRPTRSLAATAEIPLAALYMAKDIPEEQLPLKVVGSSRCYRAEAGASGVGTKGLYRVHEFSKVELFAWTESTGSWNDADWSKASTEIFDEIVTMQTEILTSLDLPCRILEMPATDLGASAYRKIDIEALFPSRVSHDGGWGELTSVSICTDYQSRRLDTRIKLKSGARSQFPHTVNGTALAVPRVLAAILEHGWRDEKGIVVIPDVLLPFMGGLAQIGPGA